MRRSHGPGLLCPPRHSLSSIHVHVHAMSIHPSIHPSTPTPHPTPHPTPQANQSIITVSVYRADNFSSLKCRTTPIEYLR